MDGIGSEKTKNFRTVTEIYHNRLHTEAYRAFWTETTAEFEGEMVEMITALNPLITQKKLN